MRHGYQYLLIAIVHSWLYLIAVKNGGDDQFALQFEQQQISISGSSNDMLKMIGVQLNSEYDRLGNYVFVRYSSTADCAPINWLILTDVDDKAENIPEL